MTCISWTRPSGNRVDRKNYLVSGIGVFPRYQTDAEPAVENAALAALGNNETVFFIDMSKRFFRADGSFDSEMYGGPSAGMQTPAFKAWAEELQPWLDRFVR